MSPMVDQVFGPPTAPPHGDRRIPAPLAGYLVLDEVRAYLECRAAGRLAMGDRTVVAGEVVEAKHCQDDMPLETWNAG